MCGEKQGLVVRQSAGSGSLSPAGPYPGRDHSVESHGMVPNLSPDLEAGLGAPRRPRACPTCLDFDPYARGAVRNAYLRSVSFTFTESFCSPRKTSTATSSPTL